MIGSIIFFPIFVLFAYLLNKYLLSDKRYLNFGLEIICKNNFLVLSLCLLALSEAVGFLFFVEPKLFLNDYFRMGVLLYFLLFFAPIFILNINLISFFIGYIHFNNQENKDIDITEYTKKYDAFKHVKYYKSGKFFDYD